MMSSAELCKRKAEWAERKADENSVSEKPWALNNMRYYQNMASRLWGEYYKLLRGKEQ